MMLRFLDPLRVLGSQIWISVKQIVRLGRVSRKGGGTSCEKLYRRYVLKL